MEFNAGIESRYDLVHGLLTWGYPVLAVEPGVEYTTLAAPVTHYRSSSATNTSARNDFKRNVRSACEKQN
jgi:hypothetical protein